MKGKYLITTDAWFIAPDGKQYRAAWGEVEVLQTAKVLGFDPNRNSANWFVKVGSEKDHIIIAGCQIHYALSCPDRPNTGRVEQTFEGKEQVNGSHIYVFGDEAKPINMEAKEEANIEGWRTDPSNLIDIIKGMSLSYFNSVDHRTRILSEIYKIGFEKYRYYRPTYSRYKVLEIIWGNEFSQTLSLES